MKILHLISSMNPKSGGVCKAVRDIISGSSLIDKTIVNEVVCLDNPNESFLKKENFKIHALGAGKTAWHYNSKLYSWLLSNRKNYDKFIVHGLWQYNSFVAYKLFKKTELPYFVMPHGMLAPYFQEAKERKLKAFRNICFWKFIENNFINHAKNLFFTSEEEKIEARKTFKNYIPQNEAVVSLGVDMPPHFTEKMNAILFEKIPQWDGRPFILFMSRIHPKKCVDFIIDAYKKLKKENPDLQQLVIAGPGIETPYGATLRNLAGENKNILFSGMLNGDAKWGAFYNCDCFILPSHQENFGIAIVEAMACRKLVLISNKVNIWREIAECGAGFVDDDTEEGTCNLLKKYLFLSKEEKQKMQENAFCTYKKYFSIEKNAEKMIQVLCSQE